MWATVGTAVVVGWAQRWFTGTSRMNHSVTVGAKVGNDYLSNNSRKSKYTNGIYHF